MAGAVFQTKLGKRPPVKGGSAPAPKKAPMPSAPKAPKKGY